MTKNFEVKNPKSDSVIGMYVDELIGMNHPLFMVRFQSSVDAGLLYKNGVPVQDAIQSTLERMRGLFGDDIPEELVRTTVTLVYAENDALLLPFSTDELEAEIVCRLSAGARTEGTPILALIIGPICAGKTTLRRERFSHSYVLIDAAQLFIELGGIDLDFPSTLKVPIETIGAEVARRAIAKHMNIVTEIIGEKYELVVELIDTMKAAGYHIEINVVTLDLPACIEREKGRQKDNVSSYYAEQYQMKWLLAAAREQI